MRRALIIVAAALPGLARAQDSIPAHAAPAPVEELELASLLDLEVTAATKRKAPLSEAPAVGNAFVREQIEDHGWLSLNEILYTQPGVFPSRDYERRTVGARGELESWNNNRWLLLVDGMAQNDVETGTAFTWEVTPLFMARSVEVLRGPGSALYGSYAMNGVIAMDTLSPADLGPDGGALGRLLIGPGTESADAVLGVTSRFGDVLLAYNRQRTDGIDEVGVDASGRIDENGELMRFDLDDEHSAMTAFFKAIGKGALDGVSWTLQYQRWEYATGRGWLYFKPDAENMTEHRQVMALRYRTPGERDWTHEYSVQIQRHGYRTDVGLYPAGAFDGYYPAGMTELVDTDMSSFFLRAQLGRALPLGARALVGVEYTGLLYDGDKQHTANADLNDPEAPPYETQMPIAPIYEPMLDHLVSRLGVFAQLSTGALLGERLEVTAGLRYDNMFFDYTDIHSDFRPTRSRSFQDLSPRLALVWRAADPLVIKLMAAHAFRAPTAVELFVANSWTASGTDIETFEAERQDTYELAVDWRAASAVRLRSNAWLSTLRGSIGYNVAEDEIVNRYDVTRAGVELELGIDTRLGQGLKLDGWINGSFVHQLSETVRDPALETSDDISRAPSFVGKLGARLRRGRVAASLQALAVGRTHRRPNDLETEEHRALRPDVIPAWVTFDAALHLRVSDWLRAGVVAKNLLGSEAALPAPNDVPFDYRVDGRRVLLEAALEL